MLASIKGKYEVAYTILERITPPTKTIVLQVQNLERRVNVFHEAVDHLRTKKVALGDGVGCETGLFFSLRC